MPIYGKIDEREAFEGGRRDRDGEWRPEGDGWESGKRREVEG